MSSTITRTPGKTGIAGTEETKASKPAKVGHGMDISSAGPKPNGVTMIVIAVGLIVSLGIQHFVASDARAAYPPLRAQIADLSSQLEALEVRLAEASDTNRDALLARLRTHGVELDAVLPFHQAGIGIETFEIELPASLAEFGLEVRSQNRGSLTEADGVANAQFLPINMSVDGPLDGLTGWIASTATFERLVTVNNLEFGINDETGLISAEFQVRLWFGDIDTVLIKEVDADPEAAATIHGADTVRDVELGTGTDADDASGIEETSGFENTEEQAEATDDSPAADDGDVAPVQDDPAAQTDGQ